jgi:hypothetical protein
LPTSTTVYPWSREANLPLVFVEANTSVCEGSVGVADPFGATFWCINTAMRVGFPTFEDFRIV